MTSYWTTATGQVIRITELSDSHLLNIVKRWEEPEIAIIDDEVFEDEPPAGYDECVQEAKARGLLK